MYVVEVITSLTVSIFFPTYDQSSYFDFENRLEFVSMHFGFYDSIFETFSIYLSEKA